MATLPPRAHAFLHPMRAARRGDRARAGAAAASLALHGVLLAWLAASVLPRASLRPEAPPRPDVRLELERPPAPPDPRPAALGAAVARAASPDLAPAAARPRPAPPSPVRAAPAPSAPAAPLQAPPAPPAPERGPAAGGGSTSPLGAPAGGAPARLSGAEANVGGFLRATVGCSHEGYMRLSAAERARCDAGYASAKGAPLPLETDKLAAFSREALRNEAKRARGEGPLRGGFVPCDTAMVGANLSPGCLPPDAYAKFRR